MRKFAFFVACAWTLPLLLFFLDPAGRRVLAQVPDAAGIVVMRPVAAGASAQVVGGQPARAVHWPSTLYYTFVSEVGPRACTATMVGPRAILVAAHCTAPTGAARIEAPTGPVDVACSRHPQYDPVRRSDFDYALCAARGDLRRPNDGFERIDDRAGPARDERILLLGYGCTENPDGSRNGPMLHQGIAVVEGLPDRNWLGGDLFVNTVGGAVLCSGDSGGAAYAYASPAVIAQDDRLDVTAPRRVIGINAQSRISLLGGYELTPEQRAQSRTRFSNIAATWRPEFLEWARLWASQNGVTLICGIVGDPGSSQCRQAR